MRRAIDSLEAIDSLGMAKDLEAIDSLRRSSKLESPRSQSQWPQDYHNKATQSQGKFLGKERKKEGRRREMRRRTRPRKGRGDGERFGGRG